MEPTNAPGLRTRLEEFKRKRRAVTVEADVEIERGPSSARLLLLGVVALMIAGGAIALDRHSIGELNDRALPVQASVLGGVRYLNTSDVDVDVTFQFDNSNWSKRVQLHRTRTIPSRLTVMVDPTDPAQSWLEGDDPPRPWGRLLPAVVVVGASCAWMTLGAAWRLHRRRRRLGLQKDGEIRKCVVLADAIGNVKEVPSDFVIKQTMLGRTFDLEVVFLAVLLVVMGVAAAFAVPRLTPLVVVWVALIVGASVTALRWRRRCIVVTDEGLLVRETFDQRQFAWSDIAAASVVRRLPWRHPLFDRMERFNEHEVVRVEAVLIAQDGARVPTATASRVSGGGSWEGPDPRNAAEMLVTAWSQHTKAKAAADGPDAFAWR